MSATTATISPQCRRVLRALEHGPVTQCAFSTPTLDGGPSISRVGARVFQLRAAGYPIESTARDEHGCAVYRLHQTSGAPSAESAGAAGAVCHHDPGPQASARAAGGLSSLGTVGASAQASASRPDPEALFPLRDFGLCHRCELVRAVDARRLCEACLELTHDWADDARREG